MQNNSKPRNISLGFLYVSIYIIFFVRINSLFLNCAMIYKSHSEESLRIISCSHIDSSVERLREPREHHIKHST